MVEFTWGSAMGLLSNWFPRKKNKSYEVELKAALGQPNPFAPFLAFSGRNDAATPTAALELYEESTAVAIPINKIAEKFADLVPVIMAGSKKITEHPILDLIRKPSPDFDQELFMRTIAINYLVAGEAFMVSLGLNGSAPKEIYPITPKIVQHTETGGFLSSFAVLEQPFTGNYPRVDDNYWSPEGLRQLSQLRNFSTRDNSMLRGRSKLISASDMARQQVLGTEHNLAVLEKGGKLSLLFHFDSELDDDDFQLVKTRIDNQFGDINNRGQNMVTAGGGLTVEDLGQSNKDMDWSESQDLSARTLALTYNYPLPLLTLEAATMNNYGVALEALYDDAITPLSKIIFGFLQRALFPRFDMDNNAMLTYDEEKVPTLVRRRNDQVLTRKELGVETDNELRNMISREDYGGGDVVYKPSSMVPVGNDLLTDDDDPFDIDDLDDE